MSNKKRKTHIVKYFNKITKKRAYIKTFQGELIWYSNKEKKEGIKKGGNIKKKKKK